MSNSADQEPSFRYWAFISYSSKDAKVAEKLHRALEAYSIPKDLRGRPGRDGAVPRKLFPVFRDRDELPLASDLGSTITDALAASRYLIVLCSPNAAKSKWVDAEVRSFKAMGRADRIIAFILDGEPNAADTPGKEHLECFPPSLKVRVDAEGNLTNEPSEPIGGDLRKGGDGWMVAFLKAVAGITGLGFNAFVRREQKRKRVRLAIIGTAALLAAATGIGWWDYTRIKVEYYQQLQLKKGVPVGMVELSAAQVERCGLVFRVESSRRKVRSVAVKNSDGHPQAFYAPGIGFPPTAAAFTVEYRENGGVAAHLIKDTAGNDILRHVYSEDQTVIEFRNPKLNTVTTLRGGETSLAPQQSASDARQSEIVRWRMAYDAKGYVTERRNENAWGVPTADADGNYGTRFVRDDFGRATEETGLGADGNPAAGRESAVVSRRMEFDAAGHDAVTRLIDRDGNAVEGPDGYAVTRMAYDWAGNVTEWRCFDRSDRPVKNRNGVARINYEMDPKGRTVKITEFGPEDEPVASTLTGVHETRQEHDARGYVKRTSYFGPDGKPTAGLEGVHSYLTERDEHGRIRDTRGYGISGEPVASTKTFIHRTRTTFDAGGNLTETWNLGVDDAPVVDENSVHRYVNVFDGQGRRVTEKSYGTDGKPCLSKEGCHEKRYRHDRKGNVTHTFYFGTEAQPVLIASGYHVLRQDYNERGLLAAEFYLGLKEEGVIRSDWAIHRLEQKHDEAGNLVEKRFMNTVGQAAYEPTQGWHVARYGRNPRGDAIREEYFDAAEQPVNRRPDTVHRIERKHDARGNMVAEEYFNAAGMNALNARGFHRLERTLDERGNVLSETVSGIGGEPVNRLDTGVHKISSTFDSRGRKESIRYLDIRGEAVTPREQSHHEVRYRYDGNGRLEETAWFDPARKPLALPDTGVAVERYTRDTRGNLLGTTYFGVKGEPVASKKAHCHRLAQTLDAQGRVIEKRTFDISGRPVEGPYGYHCFRAGYDARGNLVSRSYFDLHDAPVIHNTLGTHLSVATVNDRRLHAAEAYFDTAGKPMLTPLGLHKVTQKFDAFGREIEERYFGINGEPVALPRSGAHMTRNAYDAFGKETELSYLGLKDEPVTTHLGYHKRVRTYDERGNPSSTAFFDAAQRPVKPTNDESHRQRWTYNDRNQMVEQVFEDETGKPVVVSYGYARTEIDYDARGNRSEIRYFGADGKPMLFRGGWRWVRTYDPVTNAPKTTVAFDLDGKPVDS